VGFGVKDLRFKVSGFGLRVTGYELRVQDSGFRF
jgi:hypothetical protein